ncbi:unnamed protein product [Arabidopsis halleri]
MAAQPSAITQATLSISQCVTLKLNDTNYLSWKLQFEQFLNSQLLLGYVTGALTRPSPTVVVRNGEQVTEANNPEFLKWMQTDQLIMAWIFGSLSEDTLKSVYGLRSSQEVWFYLAKKFNRVSATRKLDIQRKIQTTTKGTRSLAQYLSEIKALCDQLDSIGAPISEQEKIYGVLSGVGREYESIVTIIEESMDLPTSPSFDDVLYKLTNFDDKLQKYETPTDVNPHQAFYTATDTNPHKAYYTARGGYSGRGRGQNREVESFPQAMATMKLTDSPQYPGGGWYPDSAATHHITSSPAHLNTSQPYDGSEAVIVGNGDFLPITHIGSISLPGISGTLPLKDVLVCPEIAKSLLSVSKLTDDYPCKFEFDSDSVCVKDKMTNRLLSQGSKLNGLYKLENPQFLAYYSSRQQTTSDEIWHKRLGHPHHQVMQHLSTISAITFNKTSKSMCEPCQLGKTSKLPFSRSEFQASRPLERIHCDVWGPAPVTSQAWYSSLPQPEEILTPTESEEEIVDTLVKTTTIPDNAPADSPVSAQSHTSRSENSNTPATTVEISDSATTEHTTTHHMITRAKDGIHKPNPRYVMHTVKGDPSLFIYQQHQSVMLLLMYVDDMVLTGNDSGLVTRLLSKLNEKFMMKDMGPLKYFLGIQAQHSPEGLFLNQEKYALDLLQTAGMLDCAPMPTPLPVQLDRMPHQNEIFQDPTYFRCLAETDSTLRAYCDSDHAGCRETRRSTGGFCSFLGSNIISWSAKRQPTVARSSTEAEYRCVSDTAAELSWITALMKEIGLPQEKTPEIYCDNLSAVYLSANPVLHTRSKHFATHFHYAREMVAMGTLIVKHIPAELQIADIFTKPLPQSSFFSLRFKLGVDYPPTSSLRGNVKATLSLGSVQSQKAHEEPISQSKSPTVTSYKSNQSSRQTHVKKTTQTPQQIQLLNRFASLSDLPST